MSTSDEKKAPPYMERLQTEHCTLCLSFQVDPVVIASDGVEMFREEVAALFLVLVQLSILIPL